VDDLRMELHAVEPAARFLERGHRRRRRNGNHGSSLGWRGDRVAV
jgi:hypothetical protein